MTEKEFRGKINLLLIKQNPDFICDCLFNESPNIISTILRVLDKKKAAEILMRLSRKEQVQVSFLLTQNNKPNEMVYEIIYNKLNKFFNQ